MEEEKVDIDDILLDLRANGESELYTVSMRGLDFIFRPLSYEQYSLSHIVMKEMGAIECNETILKLAIVYPKKDDLLKWIDAAVASDPDDLAMAIIEKSNFGGKEDIINLYESEYQECVTDFMAPVQIYIAKAFGISPLETSKFSLKKIMGLLVKAEFLLEGSVDIRKLLEVEGNTEEEQEIQMPIAPGMQSTDPMSKEFMLDPRNSSEIPPEAFM